MRSIAIPSSPVRDVGCQLPAAVLGQGEVGNPPLRSLEGSQLYSSLGIEENGFSIEQKPLANDC